MTSLISSGCTRQLQWNSLFPCFSDRAESNSRLPVSPTGPHKQIKPTHHQTALNGRRWNFMCKHQCVRVCDTEDTESNHKHQRGTATHTNETYITPAQAGSERPQSRCESWCNEAERHGREEGVSADSVEEGAEARVRHSAWYRKTSSAIMTYSVHTLLTTPGKKRHEAQGQHLFHILLFTIHECMEF